MKVEEGLKVELYSFFGLGARLGWAVYDTLWPLYSGQRTRYPFYRRQNGPQDAKNLSLTGIRSPDRPTRSESLY